MGETSAIPVSSRPVDLRVFIAGGAAGAVSRTATAPFDRLKVLLQAGSVADQKVKVTGIIQGLRAIYYDGGWLGYFRGNGTNVVKIMPESAAKFFAYETFKNVVARDPDKITVAERFLAGALAGMTAQLAIYPLETAKTRLAVAPKGFYRGISDCLVRICRHEGPQGLFRGLTPSLMGIVPYAGVDLAMYSTMKEMWARRNPSVEPGVLTLLSCGAMSSISGQIVA